MLTATAPDRSEAAEYYFTYIDQVPAGDIVGFLQKQLEAAADALARIGEARSLYRYAPDKWSIRELVSHVADTERVFAFRAFWFARGFDSPLPSFDEGIAHAAAGADARPLSDHVADFRAVRLATLQLLGGLTPEAWSRRGIASGKPFTVRALAWLAAGHAEHHMRLLRERYADPSQ